MTNESADSPPTAQGRKSVSTLIVLLLLCAYWAALFYGTHMRLPPTVLDSNNADKLIHGLAFLGLGVLFMLLRMTQGPFGWYSVIARIVVLALYGIFDEITQHMVGRDAEFFDWVSDVIGATIGIFGVTFFWWIIQGKKNPPVAKQTALDQSP